MTILAPNNGLKIQFGRAFSGLETFSNERTDQDLISRSTFVPTVRSRTPATSSPETLVALPEFAPLPSAFYRALGKAGFAECRTRQRPALGKELVYRV